MDRTFDNIRKENKILMMEFQSQPLTPEGKENQDKIKQRLQDNNRDLQAFAVALGNNSDEPRIFRKRKNS